MLMLETSSIAAFAMPLPALLPLQCRRQAPPFPGALRQIRRIPPALPASVLCLTQTVGAVAGFSALKGEYQRPARSRGSCGHRILWPQDSQGVGTLQNPDFRMPILTTGVSHACTVLAKIWCMHAKHYASRVLNRQFNVVVHP